METFRSEFKMIKPGKAGKNHRTESIFEQRVSPCPGFFCSIKMTPEDIALILHIKECRAILSTMADHDPCIFNKGIKVFNFRVIIAVGFVYKSLLQTSKPKTKKGIRLFTATRNQR